MAEVDFKTFVFFNVYSDYTRGIALSCARNLNEAIDNLVEEHKRLKRQQRFEQTTQDVKIVYPFNKESDEFLNEISCVLYGSSSVYYKSKLPYYQWSQLNCEQLFAQLKTHESIVSFENVAKIYQLLQQWKITCQQKHTPIDENIKCYSNEGTGTIQLDFATLLYNAQVLIIPQNTEFSLINGGGSRLF